jgi:hypothetical protein
MQMPGTMRRCSILPIASLPSERRQVLLLHFLPLH